MYLEQTYRQALAGLYAEATPERFPSPSLALLNEPLAAELGCDVAELRTHAAAWFGGASLPDGAAPLAQAYAGHQFGGFSPQLGDGRALLLGELVDTNGRRRDLHLKGSGPTVYSRGGDGRATLGPVLREYVMGEAMFHLGVPTTRALAVVTTGEAVWRDRQLPGAVLARIGASHLRVGTFQYFAARRDTEKLGRLLDYTIARHYPACAGAPNPALALLTAAVDAVASLLARWMAVGFIHGVMNTDNCALSGETIDYGPCAFMDRYDVNTVFSSIDHGGRYAYGNQPPIGGWNLTRLAEALIPLLHADTKAAIALAEGVLTTYDGTYRAYFLGLMRQKLGLSTADDGDAALVDDLLARMGAQQVDHTLFYRRLSGVAIGQGETCRALFADPRAADPWLVRWTDRIRREGREPAEVARGMNAVNPVYIARNHLVEQALDAAVGGNWGPVLALLEVLATPFDERPGWEDYTRPAPLGAPEHVTFCGT